MRVLMALLGLLILGAFAAPPLAPLTIVNKTDLPMGLALADEGGVPRYYLAVGPQSEQRFTVEREVYAHSTYACGGQASGELDLTSGLRLILTSCGGRAPNQGEPKAEKVHIDDSPSGKLWRYQYAD